MKELSHMLDTILKRKSVRSYTGENISKEELDILFKAASASPVGLRQYENLHLTVITNKELLDKIETEAIVKIQFLKTFLNAVFTRKMILSIIRLDPPSLRFFLLFFCIKGSGIIRNLTAFYTYLSLFEGFN